MLKATKFTIYKPAILPVVFSARRTWSVTLRDEHRTRILENGVQRNIFRLQRKKQMEIGQNYTIGSCIFQWWNREEWDVLDMWYIWERGKVHIGFWWWNLRDGDRLEDIDVYGRIILKRILQNRMGVVDWINLAEDPDRWRALVNMEMNLFISNNAGNFLTNWQTGGRSDIKRFSTGIGKWSEWVLL